MSRNTAHNVQFSGAFTVLSARHRHTSHLGFAKFFTTYTTKNYAAKDPRGTWSSIG